MAGSPGLRPPSEPSPAQAAALIAAIEQFLRDTTPVSQPGLKPVLSPWKRAALEDGVSRQP